MGVLVRGTLAVFKGSGGVQRGMGGPVADDLHAVAGGEGAEVPTVEHLPRRVNSQANVKSCMPSRIV